LTDWLCSIDKLVSTKGFFNYCFTLGKQAILLKQLGLINGAVDRAVASDRDSLVLIPTSVKTINTKGRVHYKYL